MLRLAAGLLALTTAGTALSEERPKSLVPVAAHVNNASGAAMACGVLLAHWYRVDFPAISVGGEAALPFYLNPATEAVYLLGANDQPMAVETLFCGASGGAWSDVVKPNLRALALHAADHGKAVLKCRLNGKVFGCDLPH